MSTQLAKAAFDLRDHSGENQQFFGATLRISTRSIQLYEAGERIPEPKQLVAYAAYAAVAGRKDLNRLFVEELARQLTPPAMLGCDFAAAVLRSNDSIEDWFVRSKKGAKK